MKKHYLILGLLVLMGCQEYEAEEDFNFYGSDKLVLESESSSRVFSSGDQNLNPNWEWYSVSTQTAYATPTGNVNDYGTYQFQLPYFNGSYLAVAASERDMLPLDGWELVTRDFGTSINEPVRGFPFFVVYNKFRGLLRLCYYNAYAYAYSYHKVKLTFQNSSVSGGIFALSSSDLSTSTRLNSTGSEVRENIQEVPALAGWGVADFYLGYDPDFTDEAIFKFDIYGVNISNTSSSGSLNLSGQAKVIQSSNSLNNTIDIFKSTNSLLTGFGNATGLSTSAYSNIINFMSSEIGIVKFFLGGTEKVTQTIPINLDGTLDITSSTASEQLLGVIQVNADSDYWANDGNAYKPLNDIKWGLVNVKNKPKVYLDATIIRESSEQYPGECDVYFSGVYKTNEQEVLSLIELNPNSGVSIKKIELTIPDSAIGSINPPGGVAPSNSWALPGGVFANVNGLSGDNFGYNYNFQKNELIFKIVLDVNSQTVNTDDEYVVYRTVPFTLITNENYYDYCY